MDRFQLAWEVLECARKACEKHSDQSNEWLKREWKVRVALAQCLLNDNHFKEAIEELEKTLDVIVKHFPEELREKAFLNMELSRAHRQINEFPSATKALAESLKAMEKFKAKKESEKLNADESKLAELNKAIDEVSELIAEIEGEQQILDVAKGERENKENKGVENASFADSKLEGEVQQITNIKRKAKPNKVEEAGDCDLSAEKKARMDGDEVKA